MNHIKFFFNKSPIGLILQKYKNIERLEGDDDNKNKGISGAAIFGIIMLVFFLFYWFANIYLFFWKAKKCANANKKNVWWWLIFVLWLLSGTTAPVGLTALVYESCPVPS